jgi:nucleotide-binding universal stress UspA family protein
MTVQAPRAIAHPTDFSEASAAAFAHALRIALTAKCPLYILHVSTDAAKDDWASFPHVRHVLANWGLLDKRESPAAIYAKLGVKVVKAEMMPMRTVDGVLHFLHDHPADLIVLATEARQGVARWLHGSVAEALSRTAMTPTLFVPGKARHFVDPISGKLHLRRVLIPVDHAPRPTAAVAAMMGFAHRLAGMAAEERLLHVGHKPPPVQSQAEPNRPLPVTLSQGDVVDAIVTAANEWPADLIGMPTAGHHGFLDALRGSTTERVLRQAPCPMLAVPAGP